MKQILNLLKKEKFIVLGVILVSIMSYFLSLYPINKFSELIDKLDNNNITYNEVKWQLVLFLIAAISLYIVFYFKEYLIFRGMDFANYYVSIDVLEKMYKQTSDFYTKVSISDVISIVINDIQNYFSLYYSLGLLYFVEGILYNTALTILIIIKSNIVLAMLVILPFIIQTIILIKFKTNQEEEYKKMTNNLDDNIKNTLENIKGIKIVRSNNLNKIVREKFLNSINNYADSIFKYKMNYSILRPLNIVSLSISYLILVIYGYYLINIGKMTIGDLVSVSIVVSLYDWPYTALSELILRTKEMILSGNRIDKILESEFTVKENCGKNIAKINKIEIKNLNYKIEDFELQDINLVINEGESIGIIGRTGSGKTTLLKIILRLLEIDNNKIYVNDLDIKMYNAISIRKLMSYTSQDIMLFSKTILENILFFRDCSNEELENVLEITDLKKDLSLFSEGINTVLGENGISLSGGQKQRIQLARALLKNNDILILDDSFSAVDTNTEKNILNKLFDYRKNKINILVSHKISVVKNCDKIIVLENGKIKNIGVHDELINQKGLYKEMYMHQLEGEKNE